MSIKSLLLIPLFITLPVFAQTPTYFAQQVQSGVVSITKDSIEASDAGKWTKDRIIVQEVSYDVKKTDSLLTPMIGTVQARIINLSTEEYDNRAEAMASEKLKVKFVWFVKLIYHPNATRKRWFFASGTSQMSMALGGHIEEVGGIREIPKTELSEGGIVSRLAAQIEEPVKLERTK